MIHSQNLLPSVLAYLQSIPTQSVRVAKSYVPKGTDIYAFCSKHGLVILTDATSYTLTLKPTKETI